MNAVEIEEAVSNLFAQDFDRVEFPYLFLEAFGNKSTTLNRLRSGNSNKSDIDGAVLQHNNIHIAISEAGKVRQKLEELRQSPTTYKNKAKFILATDGFWLEAENLVAKNSAPIACDYIDFPNHFGYFLALAGISTVEKISENSFDIRATSRLNKLYIELLKNNPSWSSEEKRHEMNHFMARLVFCFFAEDTNIFSRLNLQSNQSATGTERLFTNTIDQMSESDGSNVHEIIEQIFKVMDMNVELRASNKLPRWALTFPYVNGELFSGNTEVPKFNKIARSYLINVGYLDWTKVNPDIFGSMIQAVADDEERGDLGMHYTSVPNILKVLNPLFLDELRQKLEESVSSPQKLLNLRSRLSKIRVFDPACGSGNFLVIAYKEMREIEASINKLRNEPHRRSEIKLTNFRGIEIKHFSAEIARLALVIAEYQADVLYRGQQEAIDDLLPLSKENWIKCGNALEINWLDVCPQDNAIKTRADDLFGSPLNQTEININAESYETYICGNPPYIGSTWQSVSQKNELKSIFASKTSSWKSLDYVAGWFMKAVDFGDHVESKAAFVSTNSICQGLQVSILWPLIFAKGYKINFAYTSFKWSNLASNNAGVTVVVVGISKSSPTRKIYTVDSSKKVAVKIVDNINAYLVSGIDIIVNPSSEALGCQAKMVWGNKPTDGGHLLLSRDEVESLNLSTEQRQQFIRRFFGSAEYIRGISRYCIWITEDLLKLAVSIPAIRKRIENVKEMRLSSKAKSTQEYAKWPHKFRQIQGVAKDHSIIVPAVSSERREYLPVGLLEKDAIIYAKAFAIYDAPLWNMALIASRVHWVWISTVCVRMRTDFSYSNTLGWNTFPLPELTIKNKEDLTNCAEDILLAREAHFPATISELYNPETMPENLRHAHQRNDEVVERIFIGRRFKNDTERLEKLFEMYAKMATKDKRARVKYE